ncbi:hypothetical protein LXH09_36525 [Streptomyces sp. CS7]|uniref:hypothetical protein n=1 Tax=Streptomyces sp. CS-7 TaxID=2906769 RepID=UPI0021B25244|nr:hypothetical protein [Streptomyces sp. CS-7]MCT6782131.1 hypothetical protein [Streptomyces sp. CS-7]
MDQIVGVVIGGVIALGGGALTAWLTAKHQKDATRSQDLWDRRAAVYLDLLLHLSSTVSFATDPVVPGYYGPRTPEQHQLRRDLAARIDLFGSPKVRELWEAATEALGDLHYHCAEADLYTRDGTIPPDITDPDFLRLKAAQESTEEKLIKQLRHEVDVDKHLND